MPIQDIILCIVFSLIFSGFVYTMLKDETEDLKWEIGYLRQELREIKEEIKNDRKESDN